MSPSRRCRRASPEWEGREVITVAALPGRGLYVRHLGHPEGVDGVHRPTVPAPGAGPRPPAAFEPRWLSRFLTDIDVVHVHGVPPGLPADEVGAAVSAVREAGKPLVATAYHLSDPAGGDEQGFAAQLDQLLPAADAVLTLTEAAAAEIESRWGISALVVPHPHAVDFVRMRQARPRIRRGLFRVGAHLGSLRMPADPVETVRALCTAVTGMPGVRLSVHLHEQLTDRDSTRYSPAAVHDIEAIVGAAGGEVRFQRPMTDAQLWDHLLSMEASLLPPVHGSHSIWPEACYDLGTRVLIPASAHAAGQRPCGTYTTTAGGTPDPESLHDALVAARASTAGPRAEPAERWRERVRIAETLRTLYERLLGMNQRPARRA